MGHRTGTFFWSCADFVWRYEEDEAAPGALYSCEEATLQDRCALNSHDHFYCMYPPPPQPPLSPLPAPPPSF